ncbi:MAG TPA: copper resistance protein NlpE [Chloroflexi bacterium]|nr:copper resistance protein NlpE [Chloroflexota bacterium]
MRFRTPLMLFVAILLVGLALVRTATSALAAPHSQTDDAGVMQVWASSLYPAASAPGMMEFIALYPNNHAEVVTLYLSNPAIVESGAWEAGANGAVTVTLTGNQDREYDEPITLTLTPEDDMMTDGVFRYHALTVITPEEMDALSAGAAPDASAPATETLAEIEDFGRIWVSNVYPAADAAGLITMLALYDNGNMEQFSIYLGKGVVGEVGIWEEDVNNTISVTATGTQDEEYAEATTITYQMVDNTLVDGAFVLTLWPEVTPAEMANMVDPAGVYVSNVYPAADAAGYVVLLALYDNGNAEQTTTYLTKGAITEIGVWAEELDGAITLTMTAQMDGDEYAEPTVTFYAREGEILTDGPFALFKLEQITPEMMDAMTAPAVTAVYRSDTLPAASSPGRVVTLTLFDDGTLTFDTDYLNDEPVVAEVGTWEKTADGALTITITGQGDETYAEPQVITFAQDGDQLVAVEYDGTLWGSEGLTLTATPAE